MNSQYPPGLVSLAAYLLDDGLVSHQWKERPKWEWVSRGMGGREGMEEFWDSIGNVNEENT